LGDVLQEELQRFEPAGRRTQSDDGKRVLFRATRSTRCRLDAVGIGGTR
jgi:hypothetical protein